MPSGGFSACESVHGTLLTGHLDGRVRAWSQGSWSEITLKGARKIQRIYPLPDGKSALVLAVEGKAAVVEVGASLRVVRRLPQAVSAVVRGSDELVLGVRQGVLRIRWTDGDVLGRTGRDQSGWVFGLAQGPGDVVVFVDDEVGPPKGGEPQIYSRVRLWDVAEG